MEIKSLDGRVLHTVGADSLRDADLCEANLRRADLRDADLRWAGLRDADLRRADLRDADLRWAGLRGADLRRANLYVADLCGADLCGANLCGANLRDADLGDANLRRANLYGANLRDADLCEANLRRANLCNANLRGAQYSILSVLSANWGKLPDALTLELMRWDALACGDEAMGVWSGGGACPFSNQPREFFFAEKADLWQPGPPTLNYVELFVALCEAAGVQQNRFGAEAPSPQQEGGE